MRAKDVRAIVFAVASTCLVVALSYALLQIYLVTLALTFSYLSWLLTRPRMMRVIRRARGEPDWGDYFRNG